jgi:hypothetical protein
MGLYRIAALGMVLSFSAALHAQIIEFESGGLHYQTLTKNGVTIMVAPLPSHIREWGILQVAVSNGSPISWSIRPEDFDYTMDGNTMKATPARTVVDSLISKASRGDVIKLITAYESGLYGLQRFKSTNGYEQRRLAEVASAKFKAAAAASAIALVATKLAPGQSTDGAVFYPTAGKPLGPGRLRVNAAGEIFEFQPEPPLARN